MRVDLKNRQAVPQDRRAGRPPLEARDVVRAEMDVAEIDLPPEVAVDVVGVDALRAEPRDDETSIGDRRRARVGGLDVPHIDRRAFERHAIPQQLAGALVERRHHPFVRRAIVRRIAVTVQAGFERVALPRLLTALVTKTRSPQTTGLEWPSPGIATCHRMFLPLLPSHSSGRPLHAGVAGRVAAAKRRPAAGVGSRGGQRRELGRRAARD